MAKWIKKSSVFLVLGAIVGCPAFADDSVPELFWLIDKPTEPYQKLMMAGRYDRALALLSSQSGARDKKQFLDGLLCQYFLSNQNAILTECEKWLVNEKSASKMRAVVYEFLGTAAVHSKQFEKALSSFSKSIEDSPSGSAYAARAAMYAKMNDHVQASEDLEHSQQLPSLAESLGIYLRTHTGGPLEETPEDKFPGKGSLDAWNRACNLTSQAHKLEGSGDFQQASVLFEEAVKQYQHDGHIWESLGLCSLTRALTEPGSRQVQLNVAKLAFEKAFATNSDDWRYGYNLSLLKFINEDTTGAEEGLMVVLSNQATPESRAKTIEMIISVCQAMRTLQDYYHPEPEPSTPIPDRLKKKQPPSAGAS